MLHLREFYKSFHYIVLSCICGDLLAWIDAILGIDVAVALYCLPGKAADATAGDASPPVTVTLVDDRRTRAAVASGWI